MNSVVKFKNVNKELGDFSIHNLNFDINQGYVTGFIGANGHGKSSIIKLMMNLMHPDSGDIELFGMSYPDDERAIKQRIGFVYDSNIYYSGLNLKEIKKTISLAYKNWDDNHFQKYIDKFKLPLNKPLKHFSKGMQMKVSLAIALSHEAELLIMDEPTTGLDPAFRKELLSIFQEIMKDERKSIFFSTHITSDLNRFADYVVIIKDGQVVLNQSINDIHDNFAIVKGNLKLLDSDTKSEFVRIKYNENSFEALTENKESTFNIFGDDVLIDSPQLEDILDLFNGDE